MFGWEANRGSVILKIHRTLMGEGFSFCGTRGLNQDCGWGPQGGIFRFSVRKNFLMTSIMWQWTGLPPLTLHCPSLRCSGRGRRSTVVWGCGHQIEEKSDFWGLRVLKAHFWTFDSGCLQTFLSAVWGRPQNPHSPPQPCEQPFVGIMRRNKRNAFE